MSAAREKTKVDENQESEQNHSFTMTEKDDAFHETDKSCSLNKWGFSVEDLFKLAIAFLKDKDGTAVHLTYEHRLHFYSLRRQALHGPYTAEKFGDVGILDMASKDRKVAWQSLGNMEQGEAMSKYCQLLFDICPQFTPYIEAHKRDKEERERMRREEEEEERRKLAEEQEQAALAEDVRRQALEDESRFDLHRSQIQQALNEQTEAQFRSYAQQQYPADTRQQEALVQELQQQHYERYMQQMYDQQQQQQHPAPPHPYYRPQQDVSGQQQVNGYTTGPATGPPPPHSLPHHTPPDDGTQQPQEDTSQEAADHDGIDASVIAQARMWTRKDIKEFKGKIKEDNDGLIKVGQGETVTVRVPTYQDGKYLFWEFATDHYDIGFGLFFEWVSPESNNVSVLFGEGSDESELSEDESRPKQADIEVAGGVASEAAAARANKPPVDEIIPIYRRDSHEEVYAGSHRYPGTGVYLLKFDNCYSLWRSKTLYYRVYYTC